MTTRNSVDERRLLHRFFTSLVNTGNIRPMVVQMQWNTVTIHRSGTSFLSFQAKNVSFLPLRFKGNHHLDPTIHSFEKLRKCVCLCYHCSELRHTIFIIFVLLKGACPELLKSSRNIKNTLPSSEIEKETCREKSYIFGLK